MAWYGEARSGMADIERIEITPEKAKQMLGNLYEHQRPYLDRTAQRYAADMLDGKWQAENPAPIVISDTGKLIDGQHRLHAVVISGVTVSMNVATGVPESVYRSIDSGTTRTVAHRLDMPQKQAVAAVAKRIASLRKGVGLITALRGTENISQQTVLEVIDEDPEYILGLVRTASRIRDALGCGPVAAYATVLHMFQVIYGASSIGEIEEELQNPSKSTMSIQRYVARLYSGKSVPRTHVVASGFVQYCNAIVHKQQLLKLTNMESIVRKIDKEYTQAIGIDDD